MTFLPVNYTGLYFQVHNPQSNNDDNLGFPDF